MKGNGKIDKSIDLAQELKKHWNLMVIRIVIDLLGTVTKGLVQGLEDLEITGRVETIYTMAYGQTTEKSPGD